MLLFLVIACIVAYALWVALQVPRAAGTQNASDIGVIFLQLMGDFLLLPFYAVWPHTKCRIIRGKGTDEWLVPKLRSFPITFWLRNQWICWIHEMVFKPLVMPNKGAVRREFIKLDDGGICALDWLTSGDGLPDDAPVCFFAPTLNGGGRERTSFNTASELHGWRCVCFVNRGGGIADPLPLPDWTPPAVVDYELTLYGLEKVRARYPKSFLALAGVSTGGFWVRRYCAVSGKDNVADAAFSLDAGWSFEQSPLQISSFFARVFGRTLALPLLQNTAGDPPSWLDMEKLKEAANTSWLDVFEVVHCKHTKTESWREWLLKGIDRSELMPAQKSSIPMVVMASLSDGVCLETYYANANSGAGIPATHADVPANIIFCISSRGPHAFRPSGWLGQRSWAGETALQFFEAVKAAKKAKAA